MCVHARMQEFRRTRVSGEREVENERDEKSGIGRRLSGCRKRRGAGSFLPAKPLQCPPGPLPTPPFHS